MGTPDGADHPRRDLILQVRQSRPHLLLLDMAPINGRKREVLDVLGELPMPPGIIALAGDFPTLAFAQRRRVTRGTLLEEMALSSLLIPVVRKGAQGYAYFAPPNWGKHYPPLSDAEQLALGLMALGCDNQELVHLTGRTLDAIYYTQKQLRRKFRRGTNQQVIVQAIADGVVTSHVLVEEDAA